MSDKEKYIIFNPEGGLGKVIASTVVVKNIQTKYPEHKIIVVTPWPEVFLNNDRVFRVYRSGVTPYFYKDYIEGKDSIILKGEPYFNNQHLYGKQHLTKSWCEMHDLPFDGNTVPELYYNVSEKEYYVNNITSDKPILLMQTNGGAYNDKKPYYWARDIPQSQAQILVNELSKHYTIYHVCKRNAPIIRGVERVDEVNNKRAFLYLLCKSEKRLLIDSCLQHAATAFNLKSTVCWISTSPTVFGYSMHTNITPNKDKLSHVGGRMANSLFYDYDFNSPEHEYPFDDFDIFNLQDIYNSIVLSKTYS